MRGPIKVRIYSRLVQTWGLHSSNVRRTWCFFPFISRALPVQDLVLAVNLKKDFLVGNSPTHCFITCYILHNYIEREMNFHLLMAIQTSVLRTCKGIWTGILCMSDEFSKCWLLRRMSLLLSPKNNLSSCSFSMLMRQLLGCGFHVMSKDGIYPKVTLCKNAHSSHVYRKDVVSFFCSFRLWFLHNLPGWVTEAARKICCEQPL